MHSRPKHLSAFFAGSALLLPCNASAAKCQNQATSCISEGFLQPLLFTSQDSPDKNAACLGTPTIALPSADYEKLSRQKLPLIGIFEMEKEQIDFIPLFQQAQTRCNWKISFSPNPATTESCTLHLDPSHYDNLKAQFTRRKVSIIASEQDPITLPDEPTRQALLKQIAHWKNSWERGNTEAYLKSYRANFTGEFSSHQKWVSYRKKVLSNRATRMNLQISEPFIFSVGCRLFASFWQKYSSRAHEDFGLKVVEYDPSTKKILQENWKRSALGVNFIVWQKEGAIKPPQTKKVEMPIPVPPPTIDLPTLVPTIVPTPEPIPTAAPTATPTPEPATETPAPVTDDDLLSEIPSPSEETTETTLEEIPKRDPDEEKSLIEDLLKD